MNKLFTEPLFYIYLVYGLSFMIMAILIGTELVKTSAIALVSSFWMLILFAFTHGTAELTDWARFVGKTLAMSEASSLVYLGQIMMIASFVFLLQFAINLLTYKTEKKGIKGIVRSIPIILFMLYLTVISILDISDIRQMGLIARYGFGFVGSALSAVVVFRLGYTMKALGIPKLARGLNVTAFGFACYAVFGGLLLNPILGVPIQFFRAVCALTITIASYTILDVFKAA